MKHRFLLWLPLCLLTLVSACTQPTPDATLISGNITFAGSTTVQPLADKIGSAFSQTYPEIRLDIAAGGSSVGIQAIHAGQVDIGMASRELKEEEAAGLTAYQIAVDVIAVVVNESNPVTDLTQAQLYDIYTGAITNWQEVGGPEGEIVLVIREQSSGTRGAFDEIALHKNSPNASNMITAVTAGDMAAIVKNEPLAIGYVGFGNLESGLKTVALDGVVPSEENARNQTYSLTRPLLLLSGPLTQPLAYKYINFALSQAGQAVVVENGWVPVK